jgi:HEPN domain-containing protein
MKQPEVVLRELVRQWFAKAELDYCAAERLVKDPEPLREVIGFHCQQAVEKYLKDRAASFLLRPVREAVRPHQEVRPELPGA